MNKDIDEKIAAALEQAKEEATTLWNHRLYVWASPLGARLFVVIGSCFSELLRETCWTVETSDSEVLLIFERDLKGRVFCFDEWELWALTPAAAAQKRKRLLWQARDMKEDLDRASEDDREAALRVLQGK